MKNFILFIFMLPFALQAQQPPKCDSIIINCCIISDTNSSQLLLQASNYSSDLINYPGFVLFDGNGDTVAIESVSFFGIGQDQTHFLEILAPFDFPLVGILQLYSGFFATLECTYSVTLTDTTLTVIDGKKQSTVSVYPNPAEEVVIVELNSDQPFARYSLKVYDALGEEIYYSALTFPETLIETRLLGPEGFYFIRIYDSSGELVETKKLVLD